MEKKTLIAVMTCRARINSWAQYVRDTWLPLVPEKLADVRFFVGRGELAVPEDVIELDCEDSYLSLPSKVQEMCRWSKLNLYDFMLKCDDDVVVEPVSLLSSGYEQHDYSGRANRPPQPYVVPMGFNYWLSKKCLEIISEAPLPHDGSNDDEKWVAKHLWDHGIVLFDEVRYTLHYLPLEPVNKRPLRALNRSKFITTQITEKENKRELECFSRCIHIGGEQDVKLEEFKKVFSKYNR